MKGKTETLRATNWRGPFTVRPIIRGGWKIVNRAGATERVGFSSKQQADELCRVLNAAQ